jgi:hypothetical protein
LGKGRASQYLAAARLVPELKSEFLHLLPELAKILPRAIAQPLAARHDYTEQVSILCFGFGAGYQICGLG